MIHYERFVPDDAPDFETALIDTVDHIRGHLSACVDPDDDDCARDEEVAITYHRVDGGTMVVGSIDGEIVDYPLDAVPVEPVEGESVVDSDEEVSS